MKLIARRIAASMLSVLMLFNTNMPIVIAAESPAGETGEDTPAEPVNNVSEEPENEEGQSENTGQAEEQPPADQEPAQPENPAPSEQDLENPEGQPQNDPEPNQPEVQPENGEPANTNDTPENPEVPAENPTDGENPEEQETEEEVIYHVFGIYQSEDGMYLEEELELSEEPVSVEEYAHPVEGYLWDGTAVITRADGTSDSVLSLGTDGYVIGTDDSTETISYELAAEKETDSVRIVFTYLPDEMPANDMMLLLGAEDTETTGKITFYQEDGSTVDTSASIGNEYYIVAGNNNDVRAVAKIQPEKGIAKYSFSDADLTGCQYYLVKYTGSDELTKEYASEKWYHDGSGALTHPSDFGAYTFEPTGENAYKAVKKPAYEVVFQFTNETATSIGSGYSIYAGVKENNKSGNNVIYWSTENVTLDGIESKTVAFSRFDRQNDDPNVILYSSGMNVEVVLGKNLQIEANGDGRGAITSGEIVNDGSAVGGFLVSISTEPNKTIYTFTKPEPYRYSIAESSGAAIAFDGAYQNNWYLLSTLNKADGTTYYYASPIGLNDASRIPAEGMNEISSYYSVDGSSGTSVYQEGDTVTNKLVHMPNDTDDISKIVNASESFGDGDVANNYTVSSVSSGATGTITLTKIPGLKFQAEFRNSNDGIIENAESLPKDYKLLVKMVKGGKTFYSLQNIDSSNNPSEETGPVVFYEFINKDGKTMGDVPYYYSGSETLSTQVVTGTDSLSDAITSQASGIVRYNENTIGGTQNSDLTKDLYSSSSSIIEGTEGRVLKTVFKHKKDDGKDHVINVSFYKERTSDISQAERNPSDQNMKTGEKSYFFRVRLYNQGKLIGYKIVPVTPAEAASANSTGKFTHTIAADETFQLVDDKGVDIAGGSLHYDPTMYTCDVRLYTAINAGQLPQKLNEVPDKGVDSIEGYDFWQNEFSKQEEGEVVTATRTDISLYAAYRKKYNVVVTIDPDTSLSSGDTITLNVKADHQTTDDDKLEGLDISSSAPDYRKEESSGGKKIITYLIEDQTTDDFNWDNHKTDNYISGNETFTLLLKQSGKDVKEGFPVTIGGNYYTVSYDTGNVDRKNIEIDDATKVTTITHYVTLTRTNYETALRPSDVLGEASEFGIVADRYEQYGHTETNMAVNSFKDEGSNIDLGGAGDSVMPFYVGSVDNGSTLWISKDTKVGVDLYITQDINDNKLNLTTTKPVDKYILPESEINNYVNGLISAFSDKSEEMAGKSMIRPALSGNEKTLDLTQFPDNTTIYVDCSDMEGVIAGGGWHINKYPGQSVVFNMPGSGTVRVGEFYVHLIDENGNETEKVQSTTAAMDGDPARNQRVDEVILEHITFNAYEASALDIDNASALFLAPEADKVTQSNGAGWIATGGTVESHAEWHFYRHTRSYRAKGDFTLSGQKRIVENGTPKDYSDFSSMTFTFELYETDNTGAVSTDAQPLETATADSAGQFMFSKSLRYTDSDIPEGQSRTYYYVIRETAHDREHGVTYDAAPVYVKVVASDEAEAITFTVSKGSSFNDEDLSVVTPSGEADHPVYAIGNFDNTYSAEGEIQLKVTKQFTGRDWTDTDSFGFTLAADESNPEGAVLPETVQMNATKDTQTVTFDAIRFIKPGTYTFTITETGGNLPGVTYDTDPKTITVTVTDNNNGTLNAVADPTDATVTVSNTYAAETGSLKVIKSVVGAPESASRKTFKLLVRDGGSLYYLPNGTTTSVKEDGYVTVSAPDYCAQWDNLPAGRYFVNEDSDDAEISGYLLAVSGVGVVEITKDHTETQPQVTTITNTYTQKLSAVQVTKAFTGLTNLPSGFKITNNINDTVFTADNKKSGTGTESDPYVWEISGVPVGTTVTFTEQNIQAEGYNLSVNGEATTDSTATATAVSADGTVAAAEFINTYTEKAATLTVNKTWKGDSIPKPDKEKLSIKITGPDIGGTGVNEKTLTFSELPYTSGILPVGSTYKVEELNADTLTNDYTLVTGESTTSIDSGPITENGVVANLVNMYEIKKGALKITKSVTVDGNPTTGTLADGTYTFEISGPDNYASTKTITITDGESTTISVADLTPGSYTIKEKTPENGTTVVGSNTVTVEVKPNTTAETTDAEAKFTNNLTTGSLKIIKKITIDGQAPAGTAADGTYSFTVTGPDDYSATATITVTNGVSSEAEINGLKPGTYHVTEDQDSAKKEGYTLDVSGTGDVTVTAEGQVSKEVTNAYTKEIITGAAFLIKTDRPVTEESALGEPGVQFQVYDAEFTETEKIAENSGKRMLFKRVSDDDEGTAVYEFTGEYGTPDTVASSGTPGDTLETGSNGGIKLLKVNLPGKFTAVETKNLPGYESFETETPLVIDSVDSDTNLSDVVDEESTANFVDARVTSELKVIKKFSDGNTNHASESVTVTLYKTENGTKSKVETVTLNSANSWTHTWTDLYLRDDVKGDLITYQIEEISSNGKYTVTYAPGDTAVIEDNTLQDITITNTKEETTPTPTPTVTPTPTPTTTPGPKIDTRQVRVVKAWKDGDNAGGSRPASVTVHLLADGVDTGLTVQLSAANNWNYVWYDLPVYTSYGNIISYSVAEDPVPGYTAEYSGSMNSGYTITNKKRVIPKTDDTFEALKLQTVLLGSMLMAMISSFLLRKTAER